MAVETISSLFIDNPVTVLNDDCMFEVSGDFGTGVVSGAVKLSVLKTAIGGGAPTGAAGGDLSGTYPNPTVAKLNGQTPDAFATAGQGALAETALQPSAVDVAPPGHSTLNSFMNCYGNNNLVMTDPDKWLVVTVDTGGGMLVTYKAPLYAT